MKEKNHFQKQYDFLQKAQKYDEEIKELHAKAMALNDENNTMWGDISEMNMMLPHGAAKQAKLDLTDRSKFTTTKTVQKRYEMPVRLINMKNYKGPQIQPLQPKRIVNKMKFMTRVEEEQLSDMAKIKKQADF